jgi:hypothetical protein
MFAADYGPGIFAALDEAEKGPVSSFLRGTSVEVSRFINDIRARSEAVSVAFEATREVASTEMIMTGKTDPEFVRKFAATQYSIGQQILEAEKNRKLLGVEAAGGAVGQQIRNLFMDFMKGSMTQSSGR